MKETVEERPKNLNVTLKNKQHRNHDIDSINCTLATDQALLLVLERLHICKSWKIKGPIRSLQSLPRNCTRLLVPY
jgi:hypothetical protein